VVDDQINHGIQRRTKPAEVGPGAEPGVDRGVVGRIEAGVGAVVRPIERQHMDPAEQPSQRAVQDVKQARQ
jgi:hypothetical protein